MVALERNLTSGQTAERDQAHVVALRPLPDEFAHVLDDALAELGGDTLGGPDLLANSIDRVESPASFTASFKPSVYIVSDSPGTNCTFVSA